jgi:hypothetical protein
MSEQRRAGMISLQLNGVMEDAKGNFTIGYGRPKREAIVGADGIHGFKETAQVAYIEGAITDRPDLDTGVLFSFKDGLVTAALANGKIVSLRDAWYAGDGTMTTEEGEIPIRFEGPGPIEEIR